jgi:hypothetical protein
LPAAAGYSCPPQRATSGKFHNRFSPFNKPQFYNASVEKISIVEIFSLQRGVSTKRGICPPLVAESGILTAWNQAIEPNRAG